MARGEVRARPAARLLPDVASLVRAAAYFDTAACFAASI
jgi:hypothetical protein